MAIKKKAGQYTKEIKYTEVKIALRLEDAEKGNFQNPNLKFTIDETNPLGVDFICANENSWMVMDEIKRNIPILEFLNPDDYLIRQSKELAYDIYVIPHALGEE
jgi:hypothetical protein